jgi:protein disulfide-isomerase A1
MRQTFVKRRKFKVTREYQQQNKQLPTNYPCSTLKVYKKGQPSDYTGQRKADGIISYMVKYVSPTFIPLGRLYIDISLHRQSLPAVSEVTLENHEEFQKADKLVVVAYLASATGAPAAEFSATAEKHRDDYLFGSTTDEAVIKTAGVTPPAVVAYRSYDEPRSEYPYPVPSATTKDIEDWLQELAIPVIDEVSGDNYAIYAQSPKPLAYLFIDPTTAEKDAQIASIKPIAQKFKSKMNFVWIDAVKFGDHAKALNLQEAKWPAFVVQDVEKQLKYPFDQTKDVTPEGAASWVEQYLDGKLEPSLKSQPIPEAQNEAVYNLVGKTFDEIVFDDAKDVFVEFYASWYVCF